MPTETTPTPFTPNAEFLPKLSIEEFRALSPEEKRVAIARDAIAQIHEGRYRALRGIYFNLPFDPEYRNRELRDVLSVAPTCTVCGLGACFASVIRLDDALVVNAAEQVLYGQVLNYNKGDGAMGDRLKEFFTEYQLDLIECAFEMDDSNADSLELDHDDDDGYVEGSDQGAADEAIGFGKRHGNNPDERLIAILENIVANDGTFTPSRY